ncbi:MAG: DUF2183 domain-containing protein [Thioalkalispiraceae bacterium]|jgi:phosphatidate phosphatase APP1
MKSATEKNMQTKASPKTPRPARSAPLLFILLLINSCSIPEKQIEHPAEPQSAPVTSEQTKAEPTKSTATTEQATAEPATSETIPDTRSPAPQAMPSRQAVPSTNLKTDEQVLMFPTLAVFDSQSKRWQLTIHGWVFEPEHDSIWRNGVINSLALFLGVNEDSEEGERFKQRTAMFLVDNERNKNIVLTHAGNYFSAPTTGANGHFEFNARLPPGKPRCQSWLTLKVKTRDNDQRQFNGQVQCIEPEGISVISDIDDTIKDSNVLDKKALLTKTFLREYNSIKGMSTLYQHWHQRGYQFHYVSSSPWQLYPVLQQFLSDESFPRGSMHLKLIRIKDESIFNLLATPAEGKIPTITHLLETYPQRRFILVGDSGEKDPDIYASIAKKYPNRIIKIYIHDVTGDKQRIEAVFSALPRQQWVVFTDTSELLTHQALLNPAESFKH